MKVTRLIAALLLAGSLAGCGREEKVSPFPICEYGVSFSFDKTGRIISESAVGPLGFYTTNVTQRATRDRIFVSFEIVKGKK